MPNMANITVKNAAGVDVIYVGAVASAGDKIPAKWTANALSTIAGFRPSCTMVTRDNGSKTGRQLDMSFRFPITQDTAVVGVKSLIGTVPASFSILLPTNVDSTIPVDAFVQFGNLIASVLARACAADGYAPT